MKTKLISLFAVAALLAMAAPASADSSLDMIPPPRCPGGITVNDVQDCVTYAGEVANRAVDNAQDDVEDVITLICDIACNFATASEASGLGVPPVIIATACPVTPVTVNNAQKCVTYVVYYANGRIDYAQDRVEDVLVLICDVACNFLVFSQSSDNTSFDLATTKCGVTTVNKIQECVTYVVYIVNLVVDLAQDAVEDVLDYVCDVACNFVALDSSAADMTLPCRFGDVNDVQACITWTVYYANLWVDVVQYEIEYALDLVCDVACNFVALDSSASVGPIVVLPCRASDVNEVQKCLTWAVAYVNGRIDYAQDRVEDVLVLICDIACNVVALEASGRMPALAADPLALRAL
ncbi:MAG: hypothetical protein WC876_08280 [Candidatus Thermoplasmatota archaeon]